MKNSKLILTLCLISILGTSSLYSQNSNTIKGNPSREYTSWDGRKLNAIFVSRSNKTQEVTLKRVDNNLIFTLPYDKLSVEDITYIKTLKNPPSDKFNNEFFNLANKFREENNFISISPLLKSYKDEILKARPSNINSVIEKLETMRQKDIELYKVLSRGNLNNHSKDSPSYKQISDANIAMYFLKDNSILVNHIASIKHWATLEMLREKTED